MSSSVPPILAVTNTTPFGAPLTPATFEVTFATLEPDPGGTNPIFLLGFFENGARPGKITPIPLTASPAVVAPTVSAGGRAIDPSKFWYQVSVAAVPPPSGAVWPLLSGGMPALFHPAALHAVRYDGGSVSARWTHPAAGIRTRGVRLYLTTGGTTYAFDLPGTEGAVSVSGIPVSAGASVHLVPLISPALPRATWTDPLAATPSPVAIHPAQSPYPAVSLGPAGNAVALRTDVHAVTAADTTFADGGWTCGIHAGPPGTIGTFDVLLTADGAPVHTFFAREQGEGGGIVLDVGAFAAPPAPGVLYAVAVQRVEISAAQVGGSAVTTTSTGPTGEPSPLVTAVPALESVTLVRATELAFRTGIPPLPYASGVQVAAGSTTALAPGAGAVAVSGIDASEPQQITFRTVLELRGGGLSLGPPASLTLLPAPRVTRVRLSGDTVRVEWSEVEGASAYRLEIVSPVAGVIAAAQFAGTGGTVALPPGASGPYAAQVRSVAGAGTGLPSTAPVPFTADAPPVTFVATDPVGGVATVAWPAVDGAAYVVRVTTAGVEEEHPADAASFQTGPLAPNAEAAVAVAVVVESGGATVQGPFGPAARIPTAQPADVTVAYDGLAATVRWTAVPGATGYVATLYAEGETPPAATATAPAGATSAILDAAAPDPAAEWKVVVQAEVNGWTGPPSAPVPLFRPGWFVWSPGAATQRALVPATTLALGPETIRLALPPLLPAGQAVAAFGPFALAQEGDGALPATLTIGPAAFDLGGASIRPAIREAYTQFLHAAQNAGVTPWGIAVLQQVISRAMPQTFDETLFYAYGLDLAAGRADLRPGMVLRVVVNDYLDLGANVTSPWQNGFIAGGVLDYDVGSYLSAGSWLLGFDAFLAQLAAAGVLAVGAPSADPLARTQAGVAEAADLFHPAFRAPFYRLFFPAALQEPWGRGSVVTAQNFTLAAASSFTALSNTSSAPSAANAVAYFRGRAVVKLCIRVFVDGVEAVVPIGTTVGNVLERYAAQVPGAPVPFGGVSLHRARGLVVTDPAARYDAGGAWPVHLGWKQLATYGSPAATALSLPLLHGDRLRIGG